MQRSNNLIYLFLIAAPPGSNPGLPALPEPPSINVNLSSDIMMTTFGLTGEANANQQVLESVTGNSSVPASLISMTSTSATLEQSGTSEELAIVDVPEEAVTTLNVVDTEFLAVASEEILAAMHGLNASVEYSGESDVPLGGGFTMSEAATDVEIISEAKA